MDQLYAALAGFRFSHVGARLGKVRGVNRSRQVSNRYASRAEACEINTLNTAASHPELRIVVLQRRVFARFQERVEWIGFWLSLQHDKLSLHNDSISEKRYRLVVACAALLSLPGRLR